jgi:hypothetical protein
MSLKRNPMGNPTVRKDFLKQPKDSLNSRDGENRGILKFVLFLRDF